MSCNSQSILRMYGITKLSKGFVCIDAWPGIWATVAGMSWFIISIDQSESDMRVRMYYYCLVTVLWGYVLAASTKACSYARKCSTIQNMYKDLEQHMTIRLWVYLLWWSLEYIIPSYSLPSSSLCKLNKAIFIFTEPLDLNYHSINITLLSTFTQFQFCFNQSKSC